MRSPLRPALRKFCLALAAPAAAALLLAGPAHLGATTATEHATSGRPAPASDLRPLTNAVALVRAAGPASHQAPAPRAHTGWAALDAAIAAIPVYYPGVAHWHVGDKGGWGATNLNTGDIWIAPRAPLDKLRSIVVHEYAHAITGKLYGGFYPAEDAADRLFGISGELGLEYEADCMARVEGATWTWYTACQNTQWRAIARRLEARQRL